MEDFSEQSHNALAQCKLKILTANENHKASFVTDSNLGYAPCVFHLEYFVIFVKETTDFIIPRQVAR